MGFVIVSCYRSGGTWLKDLLHSHPRLTCAGEIFHSDVAVRQHARRTLGYTGGPLRTLFPHQGFKITYTQLESLPQWEECLSGLRVLHLLRDPLECLLSAREAAARGTWHATHSGQVSPVAPQFLSLPWLKTHRHHIERWRTRVRQWGLGEDTLEVHYNTLRKRGIPSELWTHLGVSSAHVQGDTIPLATSPVQQRIRNWDWIFQNLGMQD